MSVFGYVEWKVKDKATLPLRVLRKRNIWTSAVVLFFTQATLYLVSQSHLSLTVESLMSFSAFFLHTFLLPDRPRRGSDFCGRALHPHDAASNTGCGSHGRPRYLLWILRKIPKQEEMKNTN